MRCRMVSAAMVLSELFGMGRKGVCEAESIAREGWRTSTVQPCWGYEDKLGQSCLELEANLRNDQDWRKGTQKSRRAIAMGGIGEEAWPEALKSRTLWQCPIMGMPHAVKTTQRTLVFKDHS